MKGVSVISDINVEDIDPILKEPFKITKELFTSTNENFISDVNHYLQKNPLNKETFQNILGIFSIVRPKQQELLTKLKKHFQSHIHQKIKILSTYFIKNHRKFSISNIFNRNYLNISKMMIFVNCKNSYQVNLILISRIYSTLQ